MGLLWENWFSMGLLWGLSFQNGSDGERWANHISKFNLGLGLGALVTLTIFWNFFTYFFVLQIDAMLTTHHTHDKNDVSMFFSAVLLFCILVWPTFPGLAGAGVVPWSFQCSGDYGGDGWMGGSNANISTCPVSFLVFNCPIPSSKLAIPFHSPQIHFWQFHFFPSSI